MSIPVICDRCRTTGTAGTGEFAALGDLLDFDPVPVQPRVNGWDAEAQRAFIALLATTGSKRRAALAIGRNAHGITQLLKRPGSDSFRLAYDRALAIAGQQGSLNIAQGVADAAARNAVLGTARGQQARNAQLTPPSRLRGLPPPEEEEEEITMSADDKLQIVGGMVDKYLRKVAAEREARLAGRVVEADFTLRQVTCFEVMIDLVAEQLGTTGWQVLSEARRDGHNIFAIAQTPMSRMLDDARRAAWAEEGAPDRPEHPPRRYLDEHDNYTLEPSQHLTGGDDWKEQIAARDRQHAEDAQEQIAYEAKARVEWAARQEKGEAQ